MIKSSDFLKIALLLGMGFLTACSTVETTHKTKPTAAATPKVAEKAANPDGPPLVDKDVSHIPNAEPRLEAYTKSGNPKTYSALGKRYYTVKHSKGYKAEGRASWYGRKFHGQRTSSGEPYDMFAMTAAHRSLPLPTYCKVKNLSNNKEVIVKINDRGPFVHDRLIDLSYAAAKKLGVHHKGTAEVEVTAIDPIAWHNERKKEKLALAKKSTGKTTAGKKKHVQLAQAKKPTGTKANQQNKANKQIYVQLGAFNQKLNAQKLATRAQTLTQALNDVNVSVLSNKVSNKELYKVRIGPLSNQAAAQKLQKELLALSKTNPAKVVIE